MPHLGPDDEDPRRSRNLVHPVRLFIELVDDLAEHLAPRIYVELTELTVGEIVDHGVLNVEVLHGRLGVDVLPEVAVRRRGRGRPALNHVRIADRGVGEALAVVLLREGRSVGGQQLRLEAERPHVLEDQLRVRARVRETRRRAVPDLVAALDTRGGDQLRRLLRVVRARAAEGTAARVRLGVERPAEGGQRVREALARETDRQVAVHVHAELEGAAHPHVVERSHVGVDRVDTDAHQRRVTHHVRAGDALPQRVQFLEPQGGQAVVRLPGAERRLAGLRVLDRVEVECVKERSAAPVVGVGHEHHPLVLAGVLLVQNPRAGADRRGVGDALVVHLGRVDRRLAVTRHDEDVRVRPLHVEANRAIVHRLGRLQAEQQARLAAVLHACVGLRDIVRHQPAPVHRRHVVVVRLTQREGEGEPVRSDLPAGGEPEVGVELHLIDVEVGARGGSRPACRRSSCWPTASGLHRR